MRGIRALARTVLLAYLAAACATWTTPGPLSGAESNVNGNHTAVISLVDGTTYTVYAARFTSDSVVGHLEGRRFARPLSDVSYVSVRKPNVPLTTLAIVATAATIAALIYIAVPHRPLLAC
jgi:hypothetical protein